MGDFRNTLEGASGITKRTTKQATKRITSVLQMPIIVATPKKNCHLSIRLYDKSLHKLQYMCAALGGHSSSDLVTSMIDDWVSRHFPHYKEPANDR